jgi:ParB family transcriptional regulator, chromosome partitioning protein
LLARKTAPKNTAGFVAAALVHDSYEIRKGAEAGHTLAQALFSCPDADGPYYSSEGTGLVASLLDGGSDGRAQVVALGVVLAGYEDCLHGNSWRHRSDANLRYFGFLAAQGYQLSDVEQLASGHTAD